MHYPSPESDDFANVHALNAEFIAISLRLGERPELAGFQTDELDRLANVPFLLFSLQSDDSLLWQRVFDGTTDLADQARVISEDWTSLTSGTLAFLWSLARKDRHSARLFSGCRDDWCSRLASRRLICVTDRLLRAGVRPEIRIHPTSEAWLAFLRACTCRDHRVRDASSIGLFQALSLSSNERPTLASAACRMRSTIRIRQ